MVLGADGLVLSGKSADYMGVEGKLRYPSRLRARGKAAQSRSTATSSRSTRRLRHALIAAATNFVNYKDVSADAGARVEAVLKAVGDKSYEALKSAHIREHQRLFRRVALTFRRRRIRVFQPTSA